MRKGLLGSIAALAAGAGTAWGQTPPAAAGDPPAPAAVAPAEVIRVQGTGPAAPGGLFAPSQPNPVIMPPLGFGPPGGDVQGLGPVGGFGPPPGPMYPNPGPYGAPLFQPGPPAPGNGGGYGQAPHWWTSIDYLMYFAKGQPANFPLLTTSAPTDNGLIGRASTLVLAGNQDLSYNPISGFRVNAGFFGDADRRWGFEASATVLEHKANVTDISSGVNIPTLARPYIDSANVRAINSQVIANTTLGSGRAVIGTTNQTYWIDGTGIVNLFRSEPGSKCAISLDFLAGYRYLEIDETLDINTSTQLNRTGTITPVFAVGPFGVLTQVGTTVTPIPVPVAGTTVSTPATIVVQDAFHVVNRFNGGVVGFRGEARYGMFTTSTTMKFSFGNMNQRLEINGSTGYSDLSKPNPLTGGPNIGSAYGGLYANASNIGRYNNDEFAFMPEINLNVGLNVTRGLTAYLGYNFLWINNIARPADSMNAIVNTATVPFSPNYGNNSRPVVPRQIFAQDEFWIMGVNFGLMMRY
jgi:hypothetical protein